MPLKPRPERLEIDGTTSLHDQDSYSVEVRVRNVSTSGFMAECADPVRIGSYVSLNVSGIGSVRAQVRWQLGRKMGGQFVDPISLAECEWTATKVDRADQAA